MSRDGRLVTIGVETARAPRASYVYDWQTETLTQWVVPSAPEVDTQAFAAVRLESYPARDGTNIPMLVRYPKRCAPEAPPGGEPCPVIVEFHGGPEGQARPRFSPLDQVLVDAGFIHVLPNVRGSDGYGKTWLDADNGAEAPRRHHRHRGRGPLLAREGRPRRQGARRSASRAAATAATRPSWG